MFAEDEDALGRDSAGFGGEAGDVEPQGTHPSLAAAYSHWGPGVYKLVPSLPATTAAATARKLKRDFSQPWALPGWSVLTGGAGATTAGGFAGASPMGSGAHRPPSTGASVAASQAGSPSSTSGNAAFGGSGGLQGSSSAATGRGPHGTGAQGATSPAAQASAPATPRLGAASSSRAVSERGLVVLPEQPQYAEGADFMYFVVSPKVRGEKRHDLFCLCMWCGVGHCKGAIIVSCLLLFCLSCQPAAACIPYQDMQAASNH